MAVKIKKGPAKKIPKGTTSGTKSGPSVAKAKSDKAKVAAVPRDLVTPEVAKEVTAAEGILGRVANLSEGGLSKEIQKYSKRADRFARESVNAGAIALVCAWACGKLLNAAKEKLGHGSFGKWRSEHLVPEFMSERTTVRYMQLAARCHDVNALLEWSPGLRQAYIACGVLPDPGEVDATEEEAQKIEVPKKQVLMTSLGDVQRNLRLFERNLQQFEGSKEKLDEDEKAQLKLMRIEIENFATRILKLLA